ncbi:hypothetical protein EDC04DRAFT_2613279 [Pisolithus marmoratus]|nr:hypothetical protein EDC04DRAFT_2613279 [Pisolithus marmoratus]
MADLGWSKVAYLGRRDLVGWEFRQMAPVLMIVVVYVRGAWRSCEATLHKAEERSVTRTGCSVLKISPVPVPSPPTYADGIAKKPRTSWPPQQMVKDLWSMVHKGIEMRDYDWAWTSTHMYCHRTSGRVLHTHVVPESIGVNRSGIADGYKPYYGQASINASASHPFTRIAYYVRRSFVRFQPDSAEQMVTLQQFSTTVSSSARELFERSLTAREVRVCEVVLKNLESRALCTDSAVLLPRSPPFSIEGLLTPGSMQELSWTIVSSSLKKSSNGHKLDPSLRGRLRSQRSCLSQNRGKVKLKLRGADGSVGIPALLPPK